MNLKEYLDERDRRMFAEKVGISYGYLRLLVSYHKMPSRKLAAKISQATGGSVSIKELLYPDGIPRKAKWDS